MRSRMLSGGVIAAGVALSSTALSAADFRLSAPCSLAPTAGSRALAPSHPTECLFAADHLRAALFPPDSEKPHARVIVFEWDSAKSRPRPTKALNLSPSSAGESAPRFGRMDAKTWAWVRSEIGPDAPAQPPSAPAQAAERPADTPAQAQTTAVRYQYDYLGRLIYKIGNEGVRQYLYDGDSRRVLTELNEFGTVVASYSWSGDELNSITRPGLGTFYPVTDGLGSIVALTDETGEVVARFQYDAWGNIRSSSETVPGITSYRFTGYRWQEEIGLYNANARYYAPEVGRFTTQDTHPGKIEDPATLNLYAYAHNRPTYFLDLTGHDVSLPNDTPEGRKKAFDSITINLTVPEQKNLRYRRNAEGKYELYFVDPAKIPLSDASPGYRYLHPLVQDQKLDIRYVLVEENGSFVARDGVTYTNAGLSGKGPSAEDEMHPGGVNIYVGEDRRGRKQIDVVVAENGSGKGVMGLTASGKDVRIEAPDHITGAHELLGESYKYTPGHEGLRRDPIQDSDVVIGIENEVRTFHGLPLRSGKDHGYIREEVTVVAEPLRAIPSPSPNPTPSPRDPRKE